MSRVDASSSLGSSGSPIWVDRRALPHAVLASASIVVVSVILKLA